MALPIETLLIRQKEVFDTFIQNNGREVSIMPLVRKYSKEDGIEINTHSPSKILDYIKMYVESDRISDEELAKYQSLLEIPLEKKIARGKEIALFLTANRMSWREAPILGKKYTQEDGKFQMYPKEALVEWLSLFLSNNTDLEIERNYQAAKELKKKRVSKEYNVLLLDSLIEFKTIEEAASFVKSIDISRISMNGLLDSYKILFPTKKEEAERIKLIIEEAFKEQQKIPAAFIQYNEDKTKERTIKFKELLEEYTVSDIERIDVLLPKYGFTKCGFEELLKDLQVGDNKIIRLLIDKYELKIVSIINRRVEEVKLILSGLNNGINYNGSFYKFNFYDLKTITDMSMDEIKWYAYKYVARADYKKIKDFIDIKTNCRKYNTKEELFNAVNFGHAGRMATDEEKMTVIEFMEANNWPLQTQLFMDTISRYMNSLIMIENNEDETQELEMPTKMNK